jgi:mannose-6-phosphate isomerase-like protein (cupin superfamily)
LKKKLSNVIGGVFILLLTSFNAGAQDMKNMTPKMKSVLAESAFVNASEITLKPGEKTDLHTHPYYFFYALTDGKLKVHYQDGKNETFDLKTGMSGVSEPERPHITENVGKTVVRFLTVELKEHPYKAPKMMKK